MDALSVRQVYSQMLNGREMMVNLVTEDPPSSLVGRNISAELVSRNFIVLVWVINREHAGVASLVDVLANVFYCLYRVAQLDINVAIKNPRQDGAVCYHPLIGDGDFFPSYQF